MLKINFELNKHYLLAHTLPSNNLPFPKWENLQNRLWKKYQKPYHLIANHPEAAFIGEKPFKTFLQTSAQTEEMMQDALNSREFKRLYRDCEKYLEFIKRQWNTTGNEALRILQNLARIPLPKKPITVYITHPKLYRGFALCSENIIGFGYAEDYKNSSTINLCHEILHLMTKNTYIMHALIELLANNELRIRLNKEGKYFEFQELDKTNSSPLYIQKSNLMKLERDILPFWKAYLKNRDEKNIIELEKKIEKKIK